MGLEDGWRRLEIQSNSKRLIEKIISGNNKDSNIETILEDILKLRELFDQCNFSFFHRSRNDIFRWLAKFAIRLVNDVKLDTSFPMWIKDLTQKDYRTIVPCS